MANVEGSFGVGGRENLADRIYGGWYKCDVFKLEEKRFPYLRITEVELCWRYILGSPFPLAP